MPYGTLGNLRGGTRVCHMARSDGKGLSLLYICTVNIVLPTIDISSMNSSFCNGSFLAGDMANPPPASPHQDGSH